MKGEGNADELGTVQSLAACVVLPDKKWLLFFWLIQQESTADPEIEVPAAILLVRALSCLGGACSVTQAQEHLGDRPCQWGRMLSVLSPKTSRSKIKHAAL